MSNKPLESQFSTDLGNFLLYQVCRTFRTPLIRSKIGHFHALVYSSSLSPIS